ncbi:MAG TPA: 4a-hydroxytetrahydrobiopterin dehydratase [Candidatus Paceibacterota bacterium]
MDLLKKRCVPCEAGTLPLTSEEIKEYLKETSDWIFQEGNKHPELVKEFRFKDFKDAMLFVNSVANLAEKEGHHPNIDIRYNKVFLTLWTHAIKGLSPNDFILAVKIDNL